MLNYGKSDLVKVKPTFGGASFELDARLSFKKDGEGNIKMCIRDRNMKVITMESSAYKEMMAQIANIAGCIFAACAVSSSLSSVSRFRFFSSLASVSYTHLIHHH